MSTFCFNDRLQAEPCLSSVVVVVVVVGVEVVVVVVVVKVDLYSALHKGL